MTDQAIHDAHDQASALLTLAHLAREGQITGAKRAITRTAARLLIRGYQPSGKAKCEAAIWACKEAALWSAVATGCRPTAACASTRSILAPRTSGLRTSRTRSHDLPI